MDGFSGPSPALEEVETAVAALVIGSDLSVS